MTEFSEFSPKGAPAEANPVAEPISAVLLAAGEGRRLGRGPKALLRHRGRALVDVLGDQLQAAGCQPLVVVLGAGADDVGRQAELRGCLIELNPEWAGGMGSSFRRGIARAAAEAPGAAVLVALVDQPSLPAELISRLIKAHSRHAAERSGQHLPERPAANMPDCFATAAAYAGPDGNLRRGHPVIFSAAAAREAARTAAGDAGARAWLAASQAQVRLVDCTDLGDGRDIDVPADLGLLQ